MADIFRSDRKRTNAEQIKADLATKGIQYGLSIGRRAPMHKMHLDCIREMMDAGLTPVVLIGSTNGAQSRFYNPLDNPMTVAQQKEQLKQAIPSLDVEHHVITLDDVGNIPKWCDAVQALVAKTGLAGKSIAHFREKKEADDKVSGPIQPLSAYAQGLADRGLPVWESFNKNPADDNIHASDLRKMDLRHLNNSQLRLFAAPGYIIKIAQEARDQNPNKAELKTNDIPVTMLDLTFDRLRKEAGIETSSIINAAKKSGPVTIASLTDATKSIIAALQMGSEDKVREERMPTYYGKSYMDGIAMQMLGRQNVYDQLFSRLKVKGIELATNGQPLTLAELGYGTGDSSAFLLKNLQQHHSGPLHYYGVDKSPAFTEDARKRLATLGLEKLSLNSGEAFDGDVESMRKNLGLTAASPDILLAEHVLYYAAKDQETLDKNLGSMSQLLTPNKIMISVVSGPQSDIGKLRLANDSGAKEAQTYAMIEEGLRRKGLIPHSLDVPARFPFPRLSQEEWTHLANGDYRFGDKATQDPRIADAVNLVTFFGRPTEFLKRDGQLATYVNRIKELVTQQPDGAIAADARIILCASPGSDEKFQQALAETVAEINRDMPTIAEPSLSHALERFKKERIAVEPTPVSDEKPAIQLKVASASLNQTISNFTRNVPNIKSAIDHAVEDKADVLSLQELVLTGYTGDDNFKWIRTEQQQKEMIELLQEVADHANTRDPNLVVKVGFPFFYTDKKQPVKINVGTEAKPFLIDNPLYNINNKPFNAVATISGGKIQAISAKSIQPDGAAEYEPRQFQTWPEYFGVTKIKLYDGQEVPFGKVIMQLGKDKNKCVTMYDEICAEAWPGLADDGTINRNEQQEGRYLCHLAKTNDISLTINPSASKPEPFLDKASLRKTLCATGSAITGGAYIYTNCSGLEAAPIAFEGGSIYANKGEVIHTSERYDMHDVTYSSAVMPVRVPEKGAPHVVIDHEFSEHKAATKGGAAKWEAQTGDVRVYEEIMRNTGLWLRDYLKKSGQQGFFISLSGGQDSGFGAVAIIQMIDLNIGQLEQSLGSKEKAVAAFVDQFEGLKYAEDVKRITLEQGTEAGIDYLKSQMLTCAYFPSENSSRDTRDAANFLINGGIMVDVVDHDNNNKPKALYFDKESDRIEGSTLFYKKDDGSVAEYGIIKQHESVKGIGGTFHIMPMQDIVDSYLEVYAGVDKAGLSPEKQDQLRTEIKQCIKGERQTVSEEFKDAITRRILSWNNKRDDLTLQNVQARVRLPLAWLFGNDENKIACVTSNWSEAVAGYWTFGGDGHMGSINLLGGIPKSDVRHVLTHLETKGLDGHSPIPALHYINQNKASAELRPLTKDGKIAQFDEDDMMPYEALDAIARKIFIEKNSPVETYKKLWKEQPEFTNGTPIFDTKERLIADIEQCCWRWDASQFKRVAAVITPFLGQNVDPHTSVRTTIMSDLFKNGRVALKLEYLKDKMGSEEVFEKEFAKAFNRVLIESKISGDLRKAIIKSPLDEIGDAVKNYQKSLTDASINPKSGQAI